VDKTRGCVYSHALCHSYPPFIPGDPFQEPRSNGVTYSKGLDLTRLAVNVLFSKRSCISTFLVNASMLSRRELLLLADCSQSETPTHMLFLPRTEHQIPDRYTGRSETMESSPLSWARFTKFPLGYRLTASILLNFRTAMIHFN
jgi:hypothetical protein